MAGKRKRESNDQLNCRYGSSCYRKNPDHIKKYHSQCIERTQDEATPENSLQDFITTELKESPNETVAPENSVSTSNIIDEDEEYNEFRPRKQDFSETVEEVLKSMPEDFFDFWNFCSSIKKSKPHEAFADIGLHLVGAYDLLARKFPKEKKVEMHLHWRYYYDPPEFQTVVRSDDDDLYHIGYFRDDPAKFPTILASGRSKIGPELTLKGDNLFATMNEELKQRIKTMYSKKSTKYSQIKKDLEIYAKQKNYSLQIMSEKAKARKCNASTFHCLGISVRCKDDVGYRPLPVSDKKLKSILQKIADATTKEEELQLGVELDEIITWVHIANDECDFGMGYELGIDLFCFGDPCFNTQTLNLLTVAYELLNRQKYKEVIRLHLENRSKAKNLSTL